MADANNLAAWIGRQEVARDVGEAGTMRRLAAMLDHESFPWRPGLLPFLGHWLCFLPDARQSRLGEDGHPQRSGAGILPDVDLPRRMWAGSRISFLQDVPLDAPLVRTSTLMAASSKQGRSGAMLFATVRHEIAPEGGEPAIVEDQDIVYREAVASGGTSEPAAPPAGDADTLVRTITPDPVLLFRYSALTFNAHRIHYDRDYAQGAEHYPGLVVHGPLTATLLLDHLLRGAPHARVQRFEFRAISPLFAGEQIALGLSRQGAEVSLRAVGPAGVAMQARATLAG